jgi:hypothetical protein
MTEENIPENTETPDESANQEEIHIEDINEDFDTEDQGGINHTITILDSDLDTSLSQAINLSDANTFHEPTCPICSSPYRKEVEEKWVSTKSHEEVQGVLKRSTVKVSNDIINNHMRHHYDKGIKELQKVEYTNKLRRINSSRNMSTLEQIGFGISVISERLIGLNSIVPDGDMTQAEVEKVKSAETNKLMATYSKYIKMQADLMGEMKNTGEMINIPKDKFINFFNEALVAADSDEEKKIINKILNKLGSLAQE